MSKKLYDQTVPLVDALALSVMAYRANNNEYIKATNTVYQESDSGIGDIKTILKLSNRDMMLYKYDAAPSIKHYFVNAQDAADNIPALADTPTDDDRMVAQQMIAHYSGLAFAAVGGQINDFESKILQFVQNGEVQIKDFGIIASLPASYFREIKRKSIKQQQQQMAETSRFVGQLNERLRMKIKVLSVSFVKSLGCWAVNAATVDDGNLVMFFTGKEEFVETDGKEIEIYGTVKRQQKNKFHGGSETVFNRVAVL